MTGRPTVLLVATGGGHLHELAVLAERATPRGWHRAWLVPTGTQSDELIGDDDVHRLHETPPRDITAVAVNVPLVYRLLRRVRPAAVVSTGAAAAVPTLGIASLLGAECHYIESAARTDGPSLTGKLVAPFPGVHCYAQWPTWTTRTWTVPGNVFDGLAPRPAGSGRDIRRVVVMLGTQAGYGFRRAVERLCELLPSSAEVLWQVGSTDVSGLPVDGRRSVPPSELRRAIAKADAVVAHAGVGSALTALGEGRCPVLLPRERAHGEHVDDHQAQIAKAVGALGLAVGRRVDELTLDDIRAAAAVTVKRSPAGVLQLGGELGRTLWPGRLTPVRPASRRSARR